jgi:hypothetical protein
MVYVQQYSADDVTGASIDGVVKFVIVLASFAALIALVFVILYFKKKVKSY